MFDMQEGKFPIKYPGSYISPKRLSREYEMKLEEKVKCRIEPWARNLISQAGRKVLISSTINSIPAHTLMTSWISGKLVEKITKLTGDFFWGSKENKKSAKLISWNVITSNKGIGGLGIRDLRLMKSAFMAKRVLSVLNNEKKLWTSILISKYGSIHPWMENKGNMWS
ncbi:ribonuclease H protein [Canna indica]|uniref:Ribonuclease H protein n=1 Tax=Canna indica TaxID=4628 RepID=A0AAQ3JPZ1_9LILI|nr:ribonuclease H protein [Canna indica]